MFEANLQAGNCLSRYSIILNCIYRPFFKYDDPVSMLGNACSKGAVFCLGRSHTETKLLYYKKDIL